jgi:hypothetical protein
MMSHKRAGGKRGWGPGVGTSVQRPAICQRSDAFSPARRSPAASRRPTKDALAGAGWAAKHSPGCRGQDEGGGRAARAGRRRKSGAGGCTVCPSAAPAPLGHAAARFRRLESPHAPAGPCGAPARESRIARMTCRNPARILRTLRTILRTGACDSERDFFGGTGREGSPMRPSSAQESIDAASWIRAGLARGGGLCAAGGNGPAGLRLGIAAPEP